MTGFSNSEMSLKLLVDTKANKVLYAEAGKEFVDFLIHVMSLPIGTVATLLKVRDMVGCVGVLHKSIESLDSDYFEAKVSKKSALFSKTPANVPLLSPKPSNASNSQTKGYVKGLVSYMVGDNLEVKPMSNISSISLLNKFQIQDIGSLVEKEVSVDVTKGIAILKASLETQDVLMTVFLKKIKIEENKS